MTDGKAWEKQWLEAEGNELIVPDGEAFNCFELDFPGQFLINRILLLQTDGGTKAGTLDLFNRLVCPLGSESSQSAAISAVPEEMAKVVPSQNIVGGALEVIDTEGYPFRNMAAAGETIRVNKIYVRIDVDNPSGESKWNLVLGGRVISP
jgi:hypothetical protein